MDKETKDRNALPIITAAVTATVAYAFMPRSSSKNIKPVSFSSGFIEGISSVRAYAAPTSGIIAGYLIGLIQDRKNVER